MDQLDGVIDAAVARLRELEPGAIAVLLGGSYAKGTADELSDLDLTAIVEGEAGRYHTWFHERPGARPLHVSAGVKTVAQRAARASEPADWWLGLPLVEPALYAWATDEARALLGDDPSIVRSAGPPELEDFFEVAVKLKRAAAEEDMLGVRVWSTCVGELAPRLLLPLNDSPPVSSRREAAETALAFGVAPRHWAEDLSACLGLREAPTAALATSGQRLALEVLAFLREHKPDVDPLPDLVQLLVDGTLERHLMS